MTEKLVMVLGGVKIIAQIEGKNETDVARLETVASMIRNAFQPKRDEGEENVVNA